MLTRLMCAEIRLELAQSFALFFGALALGDIRYRAYEDKPLRIFAGQAMSHGLSIFDSAVGHQQAMLKSKLAPVSRRAVKDLPLTHPVVRMGAVEHQFEGGLCRRLALKYPISSHRTSRVRRSMRSSRNSPCGSIAPLPPDTSRSGAAPPRPSCVRPVLGLRAARDAPMARAATAASSEHNPWPRF